MSTLRIFALGPLALLAAACAQTVQDPAGSTTTTATSQSLATTGDAAADPGPPPHPHHPPPPEAFAACTSKAAGDACSVTFHEHTITGKCASPPPGVTDTRLVCFPDGPPPGGGPGGPGGPGGRHHGPPPEAFTACDGKAVNATCTVTFPDRTVDGTCLGPPPNAPADAGSRLACVPAHPPH